MLYPIPYYDIMRNCKDQKQIRFKMVIYARDYGVKPAARMFNTTPKTVRKWLNRWEPGSMRGLEDRSRAPKHPNIRITKAQRKEAIDLKKRYPNIGALRLIELCGLKMSDKAMRKIWHEENLLKRRRKKHKTKNDLREMKRKWRLFQQSDIDTKHLYDIPEYWIQMKMLRLPVYQYTFREVVSGLMFLAFSQELSIAYSKKFAKMATAHLGNCGVNFKNSVFQTDNGSEFIGSWNLKGDSVFTKAVEKTGGLAHKTIPPGAHTWQADVETVHNLIEIEFYEVEKFSSRRNFLEKATSYQLWFNTARKNRYKGNKTPWNIIHERNPEISPKICLLKPVFLDSYDGFNYKPLDSPGGYHLIPHSSCTKFLGNGTNMAFSDGNNYAG